MWIGVDMRGSASDLLLTVNLPQHKLTNVTTLQFPVFTSLWALCDDARVYNVVGGTTFANGTLFYGSVNISTGAYVPESSVSIPSTTPPLQPTALLSWPPNNDYFTVLYPEGAQPGDATAGLIAYGDFRSSPGGALTLGKMSYYLTGAALLS
jgi:hypothetical protein